MNPAESCTTIPKEDPKTVPPALSKLVEFFGQRLASEPFGRDLSVSAGLLPAGGSLPEGAVCVDVAEGCQAWARLSSLRPECWPAGALAALVRGWGEAYASNEREILLMEELAVDWESLQALYDLSADLQSALRPQEMLKRILGRAISNEPALRAVLLVVRDGVLGPRAMQNLDFCATSPGTAPPAWRSCPSRRPRAAFSV